MRCHCPLIKLKIIAGSILTILAVFVVLPNCFGQTKEEIINNTRLSVQLINLDPDLKTIKLENEDFFKVASQGGSRMTAYFKGDTIYKITIWNGLYYGVSQYEYYLKNFRPFFIYETEEGYPKKDSVGSPDRYALAMNFEGKYYLDDRGRLVEKKIRGRKQLDESVNDDNKDDKYDDGSNPDFKALLANADSYVSVLRARLKKIQTQ